MPKLIGHSGQFAVLSLGHQRRDVGRQQYPQVAPIAGIAVPGIPLNAIEGKESDTRHQQAHHQGGYGQQFGLQAEFSPPTCQQLAPIRAGLLCLGDSLGEVLGDVFGEVHRRRTW